ncbi:MAG: DUF72 domain-containing protein, partial [Pseudomonadota bacterium]|nr:DUF72 domain-containing protein [Pseudomonadota bacterium]
MAGALRIGTSGWHYASWRGPFYPAALKPADFLAYYRTRFSSAEINNSFYRLPTEEAVAAWREGTPEDFLFAWKASRFITHMKKLRGVEESLDLVFGRMAGLGEKLGPVLFQLPPMLRADRDRLGGFLALLPVGVRRVEGHFSRGDAVVIRDGAGVIGRGLVAYDAEEAVRIIGRASREIEAILG